MMDIAKAVPQFGDLPFPEAELALSQ